MLDLKQISNLIGSVPRIPVGFIVSKQVWDGLRERLPVTFGEDPMATQIAVDPTMPSEYFDVVWNRDVWRERLDKIHDANMARWRA